MRLFCKYVMAFGFAFTSLHFSSAFAQQQSGNGSEPGTTTQSYKIIFRQRFNGNLHINENYTTGFYYGGLCTGAQGRGVRIVRLFIDQVGNVTISGSADNLLAYGYTANAAECAELRRSLEKVNLEPATVEFHNFVNAQRPLLWFAWQDAIQEVVVNGRTFKIYRSAAWNPLN